MSSQNIATRLIRSGQPKFYEQDLQLHTNYSDGRCTVEQMVRASIANGRKTIGITDHAIGWDEGDEHFKFFETGKKFELYLNDIHAAQKKYAGQGVKVLAGLEVEIGLDGQMSLAKGILEVVQSENNLLDYIDYVVGVIHSESFTVSLNELDKKSSRKEEPALLLKNIAALIANPKILIWGHPFQVVHGHYIRNFRTKERQYILSCLQKRGQELLVEHNLNPFPRYHEWGGKSTHYESGKLSPNDLKFFRDCADINTKFVVSTDAHDIQQTSRLNPATRIPKFIEERVAYWGEVGGK